MPPLDQPALDPVEDPGTPPVDPERREVMVRMLDGTWQLCTVAELKRDAGGWCVLLAWGVWGQVRSGWYRHDPERVTALPPLHP